MITCGGGGAGVCFVVSRRTGEPWPGWKSGRLQCMGCIARKEMALSAFCCNCWDFATSLDALVSVTWVDLTFCIACSDCSHGAEKGSGEKCIPGTFIPYVLIAEGLMKLEILMLQLDKL